MPLNKSAGSLWLKDAFFLQDRFNGWLGHGTNSPALIVWWMKAVGLEPDRMAVFGTKVLYSAGPPLSTRMQGCLQNRPGLVPSQTNPGFRMAVSGFATRRSSRRIAGRLSTR